MTFTDVKRRFQAGEIDKHEYIRQMHSLHEVLFQYPELMSETDITKIEITGDGVWMTTRHGIRLCSDAVDERLVPLETLNMGTYEPQETRLVLSLVPAGSTVLDIGSNIGWYSLNLAKRFPGEITVHAFEPVPSTYDMLVRNVEGNDAQDISPHNLGMSDEPGELNFYFYPEGSGNASIENVSGREGVIRVACKVDTVDSFVAASGLDVDFIKCDVEGAELKVFRGARETLARCRPIVFAELLRKFASAFGYHPNDVLDLFAELGYHCYVPDGEGLRRFGVVDDDTVETNYFFLHPEAHGDAIDRLVVRG